VWGKAPRILTTVPGGGEKSASPSDSSTPWIGAWVRNKAALDKVAKRKVASSAGD